MIRPRLLCRMERHSPSNMQMMTDAKTTVKCHDPDPARFSPAGGKRS